MFTIFLVVVLSVGVSIATVLNFYAFGVVVIGNLYLTIEYCFSTGAKKSFRSGNKISQCSQLASLSVKGQDEDRGHCVVPHDLAWSPTLPHRPRGKRFSPVTPRHQLLLLPARMSHCFQMFSAVFRLPPWPPTIPGGSM